MNGKVETYRMNEPITWGEFKTWPDEHKITYIKLLRQKYNVPDGYIAKMMGITGPVLAKCLKGLGLGSGKGAAAGRRKWDKEGFYAWSGIAIETDAVITRDEIDAMMKKEDTAVKNNAHECGESEPVPEPDYTYNNLVPSFGEMTLEGDIDDILRTVGTLLCGAKVQLCVKWNTIEDCDEVDPETQKNNLKKVTAAATYALMNAERREKLGTKG